MNQEQESRNQNAEHPAESRAENPSGTEGGLASLKAAAGPASLSESVAYAALKTHEEALENAVKAFERSVLGEESGESGASALTEADPYEREKARFIDVIRSLGEWFTQDETKDGRRERKEKLQHAGFNLDEDGDEGYFLRPSIDTHSVSIESYWPLDTTASIFIQALEDGSYGVSMSHISNYGDGVDIDFDDSYAPVVLAYYRFHLEAFLEEVGWKTDEHGCSKQAR